MSEIVFNGEDLLMQIRRSQRELEIMQEMLFDKYPSLRKQKEILSELVINERKQGAIDTWNELLELQPKREFITISRRWVEKIKLKELEGAKQ